MNINPNPSQTVIEPIEDELSNPPEPLNDDDSNSKSNKIKNRVKELISESTSHGITHFFRAKRNVFRVMWLVLFLICISFGIRLSVANIATYLEYEVITNIELIQELPIQFPTISFQFNLGNSEANYSLEDNVIKLYYENFPEKNILNEFEQLTSQTGDVFFKYNSGKNFTGNSIDVKNQKTVGYKGGMLAEIFIGKPNEFSIDRDYPEFHSSYFSIYIHNSSINAPESTDEPIRLTPGVSTSLKISRVVTDRLGEPFNDCVDDLKSLETSASPLVQYILTRTKSSYRQKDCFSLCYVYHVKENCELPINLGFEWELIYGAYKLNISLKPYIPCINKEYSYFINNKNEICAPLCPAECDSYEYSLEYMTSKFPTQSYAQKLINDPKIKAKYDKGYNITLEDLRESLVSFSVYYSSLSYTKISQLPKMDLVSAISEFGGILGLFVGISFLSFGELVEILGEIIMISLEKNRVQNTK